jgi:hypothetical protein
MTEIESLVRTIGALGVIAGTILVVLQLRVNARNVKSRNAFDLISRVIDPSFPRRRHQLYEVAERRADGDWNGFDRSLEDFEVRNFANIYEQLGLLVRRGVVDLRDLLDAVSIQPMADWATFQPIRAHIIDEAAGVFPALAENERAQSALFWPNFAWLAEESREWMLQRAAPGAEHGASRRRAGDSPGDSRGDSPGDSP